MLNWQKVIILTKHIKGRLKNKMMNFT